MACATSIFKVCDSPGKGMGMFADRLIARGELIIAEKPLLTLDQNGFASYKDLTVSLEQSIEKLNKQEKDTFYSLQNSWPQIQPLPMAIFKTNGLPLGVDSPLGAIFPNISRINHSCLPNVNHYWNETKGMETIYALRDIAANEEILTAYKCPYCDTAARQAMLKEDFQFECKCQICSLEDKVAQKRSDVRRNLIKTLDAEIFDVAADQPDKAMGKVFLMQKLLNDEGVEYDANKMGNF